jgi:hypothetical protein
VVSPSSKRGSVAPLSLLLAIAVVFGAVFAACQSAKNPRFPHVMHLTELACGGPGQQACLSCASCHAPSQKGRAHKLPNASLCEECHKEDAHEVAQVLESVPDRPHGEISFNHDKHLAMGPIAGQCVPCHAGVVRADQATIPPMSKCFSCHEHEAEWERGECAPCHEQSDLRRTMPETFLRHDEDFMKHHGSAAVTEQKLCQSCHAASDCQACHDVTQALSVEMRKPEKIEQNFVHKGDFMVRHAIEAQSQSAKCASCHEPQDCDACHVERGVSGNALNGRNPHPPGWVGGDTQANDFHGQVARRDLLSCAGCHEQGPATNCIRCHKVGAYGGNPHPRGWKSAREPASQMCRYCHEGP